MICRILAAALCRSLSKTLYPACFVRRIGRKGWSRVTVVTSYHGAHKRPQDSPLEEKVIVSWVSWTLSRYFYRKYKFIQHIQVFS